MGSVDHELCRRMDELAMKGLELMDEILARRSRFDGVVKEGFIDMAKARYSMGNHAVSILQLPTEDSDVEAKRRVFTKKISDNTVAPYTEFSLEVVSNSLSKSENDSPDDNVLRKRNVEEINKSNVGSSQDDETISSSRKNKRKDLRHKDPLLWFGVLVPSNLKASQKSFQNAVSVTCELATMQSELLSVVKEFRALRKQKYGEGKSSNDQKQAKKIE